MDEIVDLPTKIMGLWQQFSGFSQAHGLRPAALGFLLICGLVIRSNWKDIRDKPGFGRVLSRLKRTERLEQDIVAFRAALNELEHALMPLNWAATQNNLGNTLQILGRRESGKARLEEAVTAYDSALAVFQSLNAEHEIYECQCSRDRAMILILERRADNQTPLPLTPPHSAQ